MKFVVSEYSFSIIVLNLTLELTNTTAMFEKFKDIKVSRKVIHHLVGEGDIKTDDVQKSFEVSGVYPEKKTWLQHLDRFLLGLGTIFLLSGIIFFFAYNWAELHKFVKLGMVEVMIAGVGVFTLIKRKNKFAVKIGLTTLSVLTGCLFALYGQIYQTGANAYDFFLGWTLCVAVFVLISRFPPLWLFHIILINTTIILYAAQVLRFETNDFLFLILFMVNAMGVMLWELFSPYKSGGRWFPRVVGLGALFFITTDANMAITHGFDSHGYVLTFIVYLAAMVIGIALYKFTIKDLFMLASVFLSIIITVMVTISEMTGGYSLGSHKASSLISGVVCIGITTYFVWQLVKTNKQWRAEA